VRPEVNDVRLSTYGHLASPGHWAIGGHLPQDDTRWDLGREAVTERSRRAVTEHVRRYVTGVVPEPTDVVYCDVAPGLGDGLSVVQSGPVTVAWGDNLFKFAPAIGGALARAALERSIPAELDDVRHPVASVEDDRS
jgi:sarcosine oxidase